MDQAHLTLIEFLLPARNAKSPDGCDPHHVGGLGLLALRRRLRYLRETIAQGMFVGAVSDNFDEHIKQKIFHAEIVIDVDKVVAETKAYQPIPIIAEFLNEDGSDSLSETIEANYKCVKQEILSLVESEIKRAK